jgi:two-component system chemotaxis sensor kinase CheA
LPRAIRPAAEAPLAVVDGEASKPKTTTTAASDTTLRVDVVLLNRMMNLVGELVLTRNQILQATPPTPTSRCSPAASTWSPPTCASP